jgi:hypothetical protein
MTDLFIYDIELNKNYLSGNCSFINDSETKIRKSMGWISNHSGIIIAIFAGYFF